MNKLKLSLENFQSISSGELEFETGLNFIIGQSNSGKSATFRALKACLSNPAGSQRFIKNGTKHSVVTLDYDGNSITWKRTPKESSYFINGEDYVKTGNSNAFKILEDTGFTRDTNDVIMNIEEELQLPFPFGMSKSDLFKLYEDVFCVSDSAVILKSAKEHEESVKDEIESLENELLKNKRKLEELNKFKEEVDINLLNTYKNKLVETQSKLIKLNDGLDLIKQAVRIDNAGLIIGEETFEDKLTQYRELIKSAKTLSITKKLHSLNVALKEVSLDITPMLDKYNELVNLKSIMNNLKQLNSIKLPQECFENKMVHFKELKEYRDAINGISNKIKVAEDKLIEANTKVATLQDKLKEFKVCPLCHKPLD